MLRNWLSSHWRWVIAALLAGETVVLLDTFTSVTVGPFLGVLVMVSILIWDGGYTRPSQIIDFIGRASYHLFIAHMSIAAVLVVGFARARDSFQVFAITWIVALALSGFLVPLEWRLNRIRGRITRRASRPAPLTDRARKGAEAIR
jgi:hypothetical protein